VTTELPVTMELTELLRSAVQAGASDVHLKAGNYPMMRVHGALRPASQTQCLEPAELTALAATIIPPALAPRFLTEHEVDFAHSVSGLDRFRCNVFKQRGTVAMALRVIPEGVSSVAELGLPPVLTRLAEEERGLILLTGTTGSGKSTTLASLIDHINRSRAAHVVTVEDPIEYLHQDRLAIISQREVDVDTSSFAAALRSALRQDPDVILVGEMRDLDTIEIGLTAAETGHLVMSTVHTLDATETINRLVTVFPTHQHGQVRQQLASVLRAVISQRLLPRADGTGRCVAIEIMVNTPFVRECISDPARTHLIVEAISTGATQYGMQTFDQSIFELYKSGLVSYDTALRAASNPDEFKLKIQGVTDIEAGEVRGDAASHDDQNLITGFET
jgi:twitching motility protein PilT